MTALDVFQYAGQQVRTVIVEGEPWFVAADVCRILEHSNVSMAVAALDDDEKGLSTLDTPGGRQSVTTINEPGLYSLILRSRKQEAKAFKRWVTHEVLPAIRRTGAYAAPAPQLPQSYAEALRELAATVEQNAALEAKVAEDAPKVLFADSVATSDTTILVGDLAKILRGNGVQVGANRLFAMLREDGYLIRRQGADWNMPTQRAMELGLFKVKETAITHSDGHVSISKTPKVTGKGQAYFVNRYAGAIQH